MSRRAVELVDERPVDALLAVAEEHAARFIVVGGYGESPLRGAILGSTPHKLLHLSETPVVVVPLRLSPGAPLRTLPRVGTWEQLAELPVEVEGYSLEGLEQPSAPSSRATHAHRPPGRWRGGRGRGRGLRRARPRGLPGRRPDAAPGRVRTRSARSPSCSDGLELFPAPPVREPSRNYRRWAFESAALDLALRQAGKAARGGRGSRAAAAQLRGLDAPDAPARASPRRPTSCMSLLGALPRHALQARPDQHLVRRADRGAGGHRRGRLARPQGPLQGHAGRRGHRPRALPQAGGGLPRRLARGPRPQRRDDRRSSSPTATASPGTPRSTRWPTSRRSRSRPRR